MEVCKHNKFGFCKFGDACPYRHLKEVCSRSNCSGEGCDTRHPRRCKYFSGPGSCWFGAQCAYRHCLLEREDRLDTLWETVNVSLKFLIRKIDCQLVKLTKKIKALEHHTRLLRDPTSQDTRRERRQGELFPNQWCGDCGADWDHHTAYDYPLEAVCQECQGWAPVDKKPAFNWISGLGSILGDEPWLEPTNEECDLRTQAVRARNLAKQQQQSIIC